VREHTRETTTERLSNLLTNNRSVDQYNYLVVTELLFFDTSALVKRYYDETATETVDELVENDHRVVITSFEKRPRQANGERNEP